MKSNNSIFYIFIHDSTFLLILLHLYLYNMVKLSFESAYITEAVNEGLKAYVLVSRIALTHLKEREQSWEVLY